MRTHHFLFVGLAALAGASIVACDGDDSTSSVTSPSDASADVTASDAGPDGAHAISPDAASDAPGPEDSGDAGSDSSAPGDGGPDAADADVADANDASDANPSTPASVRLSPGTQVFGVTTDGYVIYWMENNDAGVPGATQGTVAAISLSGGQPQILSRTVAAASPAMNVAVAGATVVWTDNSGVDAAGCPLVGHAIQSWSSARGVSKIAPYAIGSYIESPNGVAIAEQTLARLSADGSKIAYAPGCVSVDGGTQIPEVALAATDGTTAPLTAALTPAPSTVFPYIEGNALTVVTPSSRFVFNGNPLTAIPNVPQGVNDPTGAWAWTLTSSGGELVLAENGSIVFTDPTATSGVPLPGLFDATGSNLFYKSSDGVKRIALVNPGVATTLVAGPAGDLVQVAPNGSAVLCDTAGEDGGTAYQVVTAGTSPAKLDIPATDSVQFLSDSTLVWRNGATLFSEPVLGGPVATLDTSIIAYQPVGGSQVAIRTLTGAVLTIVDATGKLPVVTLDPAPTGNALLVAPPAGGFVAYVSNGAIYAQKTK